MENLIQNWWHYLSIQDREFVSKIPYNGSVVCFLEKTDEWWDSLSFNQKQEIYDDFYDGIDVIDAIY